MRSTILGVMVVALGILATGGAEGQTPEDPFTGDPIFEGARFSFRNGSTLRESQIGLICAQLPDDLPSLAYAPGQEFLTVDAEQVLYSGAPVRIEWVGGDEGRVEFVSQGGGRLTANFVGNLDTYGRIVVELRSTQEMGNTRFKIEIGPGYSNAPLLALGLDEDEIWVRTFVLDPFTNISSKRDVEDVEHVLYDEVPWDPSGSRYSPVGGLVRLQKTITTKGSEADWDPLLPGIWGGVWGRLGFEHVGEITITFHNGDAEDLFLDKLTHLDTTFGAEQEVFNLFLSGQSHPLYFHEDLNVMDVITCVEHTHDLARYPARDKVLYMESTGLIANGHGKVLDPQIKNSVYAYDLVRDEPTPTTRWGRVDSLVVRHDVGIAKVERAPGFPPQFGATYRVHLYFAPSPVRNSMVRMGAVGSRLLMVIRPRTPWQAPQELGF